MGSRSAWDRPRRAALASVAALLVTSTCGCTRSSVPVEATPGSLAGTYLPSAQGTSVPFGLGQPTEGQYAVVWVAEGDTLAVRVPAGISGTIIARFPHDERGLSLNGNALFLGNSLWVEIGSPAGPGWVNSWYLTESRQAQDFCGDQRVVSLLQAFLQVIDRRDGAALPALTSPKHGLVLRHDWWNPEVVIQPSEVQALFTDRTERDWGTRDAFGSPITGSFSDVLWPELVEMVRGNPSVSCGSLTAGQTARPGRWPGEYANLNYYAFHVADPASSVGLNWRTWAIGIEYVEGQPYITVVVQYRGEM